MESKTKTKTKTKFVDTENRPVVARGKEWGVGEMGVEGQKIQTYSYKINQSWGCNVQHVTIVNNTVLHI